MAFEHLQLVDPSHYVKPRQHETRVGQAVALLAEVANESTDGYAEALAKAYQQGQRVAVVGVPESIGPRANLGRSGAEGAWEAFLGSFLNLQATPHLPVHELLLVGAVSCGPLQQQAAQLDPQNAGELARLRELCGELDQQVMRVLRPLFQAGFEVILVGGGHNNAYPLLRSLADITEVGCGAVNLDPHADFRLREGRHSGNGFSYAYVDGALEYYHVVGLHEGKNNATSLKQMRDAGFRYHSIHRLYDMLFTDAMQDVTAKAASWLCPLGIEVDVDALSQVPASAFNYTGLTVAQGYRFVSQLAEVETARYVHLAEAAPALHPSGTAAGELQVGQLLSELALAYLHGRQRRNP
ncbi:MAG: arginase family protein [Idiomarina sp.]